MQQLAEDGRKRRPQLRRKALHDGAAGRAAARRRQEVHDAAAQLPRGRKLRESLALLSNDTAEEACAAAPLRMQGCLAWRGLTQAELCRAELEMHVERFRKMAAVAHLWVFVRGG